MMFRLLYQPISYKSPKMEFSFSLMTVNNNNNNDRTKRMYVTGMR